MGTWGSGPFENDGAGDLLAGLREGGLRHRRLHESRRRGVLEADDAQAAIAYAEIVAVGRGIESASPQLDGIDAAAFCASLTPEQHAWILTTLERAIADSDTSELHELWAENGPEDLEEWRAPVARRLESLRALG
ncbi:DUF4259 domain-containing protein [Rhodococcus hoagii]|nr:DUF4259 domain-containing protein [Prescottella equi]